MNNSIVIIDYGVGNLLSLKRAVENLGYKAILTSDLNILDEATHIFLPGVGAFKSAMNKLEKNNITNFLKNIDYSKKKLMGICLGMQMLLEKSDEFGISNGLGLINGVVKKIEIDEEEHRKLFKVPNVGWRKLERSKVQTDKIFSNINNHEQFYFVHSYRSITVSEDETIAYIQYSNLKISAIIKKNNIYGCQFHPEKSGKAGLTVLKNFLSL